MTGSKDDSKIRLGNTKTAINRTTRETPQSDSPATRPAKENGATAGRPAQNNTDRNPLRHGGRPPVNRSVAGIIVTYLLLDAFLTFFVGVLVYVGWPHRGVVSMILLAFVWLGGTLMIVLQAAGDFYLLKAERILARSSINPGVQANPMERVGNLAIACRRFAQEHNHIFPSKLSDLLTPITSQLPVALQSSAFNNESKDPFSEFIYLAADLPDDAIPAESRCSLVLLYMHDAQSGARAVGFADETVRLVADSAWGDVIENNNAARAASGFQPISLS
jgi:hypothetical protein